MRRRVRLSRLASKKIVLMSSFCTSLRIARCSHTKSMLRSRSLALHKNNLTIYDFLAGGSDEFFLHKPADSEMLTYKKYAALSLRIVGFAF